MLDFAENPERVISMGVKARNRLRNYSVEAAVNGISNRSPLLWRPEFCMRTLKSANDGSASHVLLCAVGPLIVTFVLWATSVYDTTVPQLLAAFILSAIPWVAYQECVGDREKIPLFALISAMYWIAYAIPLFWTRHEINLIVGRHQLSTTR